MSRFNRLDHLLKSFVDKDRLDVHVLLSKMERLCTRDIWVR